MAKAYAVRLISFGTILFCISFEPFRTFDAMDLGLFNFSFSWSIWIYFFRYFKHFACIFSSLFSLIMGSLAVFLCLSDFGLASALLLLLLPYYADVSDEVKQLKMIKIQHGFTFDALTSSDCESDRFFPRT